MAYFRDPCALVPCLGTRFALITFHAAKSSSPWSFFFSLGKENKPMKKSAQYSKRMNNFQCQAKWLGEPAERKKEREVRR